MTDVVMLRFIFKRAIFVLLLIAYKIHTSFRIISFNFKSRFSNKKLIYNKRLHNQIYVYKFIIYINNII